MLDGQFGLGAVGNVDVERIGVEGEQGVIAHQSGDLGDGQRPVPVDGSLEGSLVNAVVVEELGYVVDDDLQVVGKLGQRLAVAQIVDEFVADSLLAGAGSVGVPDVLAVPYCGR